MFMSFPYRRILRAIALYKSVIMNPRNTEDVTHAVWDAIFNYVCSSADIDMFLSVPQFRVYLSPRDEKARDAIRQAIHSFQSQTRTDSASLEGSEDDFDARSVLGGGSQVSVADGKARGVITDFCILLPVISSEISSGETLPTGGNFAQLMCEPPVAGELPGAFATFSTPGHGVAKLIAPVLCELKRPISRHPHDIVFYVENINARITEAQNQVEAQGECLFHSPKFGFQSRVILVAAAGEFFSVMAMTRDMAGDDAFDLDYYESLENVGNPDMPDPPTQGYEVELLVLADEQELSATARQSPDQPLTPAEVDAIAKHDKELEEQKAARVRARGARAGRPKSEPTEADKEAAQHYLEFIESTKGIRDNGQTYFTEGEMNRLHELFKKIQDPTILDYMDQLSFTGIAYDAPRETLTFEALRATESWSPVMRFGSPAANAYLEFLVAELKGMASDSKLYMI